MNASAADRSKASRIRSKGARASAADRAWLARYDARDKPARATREERPAPAIRRARERAAKESSEASGESRSREESTDRVRPANLPADGPPSASGAAAAPPVSPFPEAPPVATVEPAAEPYVRIDATPEPASATAAPSMHASDAPTDARPKCPVPDCQACREGAGGLVCVTTGKRVWPRMTIQGARGISSAILFAIGQAIRLFRPDRRLIPPTRDEVDMFAEALTEVAYRRASWASRWDDLSALAFAFGRYAMRASSEPDQKPAASSDELARLRARIAELEGMRAAA